MKIKVLNRVAYGYRNFSHFKKRILIHFKMKSSEPKVSWSIKTRKMKRQATYSRGNKSFRWDE